MELPNSLVCRYCGDKLLPHSIRSHERSCRRKLVKIVDVMFQKDTLKFDYPPEYSEWPIPSKSDLQKYNDHAQREFKESQQACPRCGSRFSMFEMQDHVLKCEATEFAKSSEAQLGTKQLTEKLDEKRRDQTIQISLGVPEVTEDTSNQGVKNKKEKHVYSEKDVKAIIKLTERVQNGHVPDNYKDVHSDNSIKRILHYYNRQEPKNKYLKQQNNNVVISIEISEKQDNNNKTSTKQQEKVCFGGRKFKFDDIPLPKTHNNNQMFDVAEGPDNRVGCKVCKRMFDPSRINKHEESCNRVKKHQENKVRPQVWNQYVK
ncbi:C2HC-type_zinc-finger domain-containing protein [Hexamita inflata]|uniref:C2HC-type zinc-finger domain-containing protein n=1 Tax=Hexamita inflata TaxID=28002 RepID=A0AA86UHJ0_9EUKA|nr:C2HC-type zinc-finger domain-containing protein [Hexamita inflata]CAI9940423.1 C2HC-type zinc-finger domain-containing protein [Hexamita inflata]